ncbi:hypothetical protein [Burkholderia sp. MSMB1835]|uniref:hypothetical protein n=1 Tax=Burkholderia sp. MSMB1835 TaxID=1637876 RepID=UPI000B00C415|nr:hypothetical protein [Burkholderia sp. MSMB1835]
MPYASIADDSEVDPDRPIKCCDDIHSICHYLAAPAMCGREASRDRPTIGEILTVATFAECVHTRQCGAQATVSVHFATRIEVGCYVRAADRYDRIAGDDQVKSGWNEPTCRRKSRCRSADPVRMRSDAADDVVEKRAKRREENGRPVDRAHGSG